MDASAQARFDLIRENLDEILNPEIVESILAEGRNPRIYWGNGSSFSYNNLYFS
jgi:tyrosyl-tRNA synthetase